MPRSTFVRRVRFGNSCPSPAIIKNGGKWIMKVLVTGVKGQLGHDVMNELALRGIEGFGVDVEEMDITDRTACETVISQEKTRRSYPLCSIYCSRCCRR